MKKFLLSFAISFAFAYTAAAQNEVNWTPQQLLEPSVLAAAIQSGKDIPVIYSVGPGAMIPHSVAVGMGNEAKNIEAFKRKLSALSKDAAIVVYCGCCPFEHCPNVRPAIAALKETGFTNYKLLNLPRNIKADWKDKGYPVVK